MKPLRIAVVDLETTGPHVEQGDRIIQIAAVIYENGQVLHTYSMFLNPEQEINSVIRQLTGIQQEQVDKVPTFEQVAGLWYERLKDCVFVAHNLSFDLTFLQYSFALAGCEAFTPLALDTVVLSKIFFPTACGFNLSDLSNELGLSFNNPHNALEDAKITACLLSRIAEKIMQLDYQTKLYLQQLMQLLPFDYDLLNHNPKKFKLSTELFEKNKVKKIKADPINFETQQKMALLAEKISHLPHLIVKNQGMMLTLLEMKALLKELTAFNQILLVVPDDQVENYLQNLENESFTVARYLTPSEVLEKQAVFRYLASIEMAHLNQQERVHLAGIIYWLSYRTNGSIHHLNSEFRQNSMTIARIQTFQKKRPSEYESLRKKYQKAPYLVISMTTWHLLNQEDTLLQSENTLTFITDLAHWVQSGQHLQSLTTPLSQLFMLLRQIQEQHPRAKIIQKLVEQCHQVMDYYSTLMADRIDFEINDWRHLVLTPTTLNTPLLKTFCENLLSAEATIKRYIAKHEKRSTYQKYLHTIQKIIENMEVIPYISTISGHVSLGQLYQLQLQFTPLTLSNHLSQQHHWVIWQADEHELWSTILENAEISFTNWKIPTLSIWQSPLKLSLPLNYLASTTKKIEAYILEFLCDYYESLPNHLVIIANSRHQVAEWYRLLRENDTLCQHYTILAQGIHGRLRKIQRRYQETNASIRIIQRTSLDEWIIKGMPKEAWIIPQLPFQSFEAPQVNMLSTLNQVTETELFTKIVLPLMIAELQHLVQYAFPAAIYLFDERLITKFYAEEVTQVLSRKINISLQHNL